MAELMARFARCVLTKLHRLITGYTETHRQDDETTTQVIARRALSLALDLAAYLIQLLPVRPSTQTTASTDLHRLAKIVWPPPILDGAQPS